MYPKILVFLVLIFLSCNTKQDNDLKFQKTENKKSLVKKEKSETFSLKVKLPQNINVYKVFNIDLNGDNYDEQIVIYREKDKEIETNLKFYVLGYLNNPKNYVKLYSSELSSSNVNTLSFYPQNFTDDGEMELVFLGISKSGQDTIDIFKKSFLNEYKNILSLQVSGYISIEKNEKNGKVSIIAYSEKDKVNEFNISQYDYSKKSKKYYISQKRHVVQNKDKFGPSFKSKNDFLEYLSKYIWQSGIGNKTISVYIENKYLYVMTQYEDGDRVIDYYYIKNVISNSWGNILSLYLSNELVNQNERVSIRLIDKDSLSIIFLVNHKFTSKYKVYIPHENKKFNIKITLSGIYNGDNSMQYIFSNSDITLKSLDKIQKGTYIIYPQGKDNILQMEFLNSNNKINRLDYVVQKKDNKINLIPIKILSTGIVKIKEDRISLQKESKSLN